MWSALLLVVALVQAPQRQLLIVSPTLQQFEDGPAIYAGHRFIPGETVFFSFQVRGFAVTPGEEKKVHLMWRIDALDSAGVHLVEEKKDEIDAVVLPEDKEWAPKVRYTVLIPPHAGPGGYHIVATVKDTLSGQEAKIEVPFPVQTRSVEPSETLLIGDSPLDTQAARAAGCHIFCVSYGYSQGRDVRELDCDAIVATLLEAVNLLRAKPRKTIKT